MFVFVLSMLWVQVPLAEAKTLQNPTVEPDDAAVVLNVNIGGVSLPYTWGDVSGKAGYKFAGKALEDTFLMAEDTCAGIKIADLLADVESSLAISLAADDNLQGVSSDGYGNSKFTVAEAKDYASNHYLLANKVNDLSEACIGYNDSDPSVTYPATYLRIARNRGGNYETDPFGNTAYMRLISAIKITKADGSAIALGDIDLSANNGADLASLSPASAGLVIGGTGINKGKGLLGSFVYFEQAEIDYIKAKKSVNGMGIGAAWTDTPVLYSSYHNHGAPSYKYMLAEGINLKTALTALGADVTHSAVAVEAKGSDGYNLTINDAFGHDSSRNYIAPEGTIGNSVDPMLVFYENSVDTASPSADTSVPTTTAAITDANPLFVYGQTEATESNNCSFIQNTVKIRAGLDVPAFTLNQEGIAPKSISLSEIALLGIYQTSYFWEEGTEKVTESLKGVPLSVLLNKLAVTVAEGESLNINVNNGSGQTVSPRSISREEISKCFVAFDAFANSQRIRDCNTPLRIYCPGQTQSRVLIENVVGATVGEAGSVIEGKMPGGDINNSVFYIAVKDASAETKYYYYTKAELQAYEKEEAYTYDDHSVIKTVTCKGALLKDLLDDLKDVTITADMVVQYAEEDGYHADAAADVINSSYKDTVASLTGPTVDGGGSTKQAMRSIVTYAIHEEYAQPDQYNVNDAEGVFKDADNKSGYLRAYRDTGGANSAVIKYLMGVAVSKDGALLSGNNGCVINSVSDKNTDIKVRDDITIKGLVPGMQYAVKAPPVTNAHLAGGQPNLQIITVGAEKPPTQVISFRYAENTYFYVKNGISKETVNYTYTDLIARGVQVPSANENTAPYGYSRPMYYRYNGIWLNDLIGSLSGEYTVKLVAQDGSKVDITDNIADYFVACNNTQSKSSTNIPEGKRVTVNYSDAKIIIPSSGVNITGSAADDYTTAGKNVELLMEAAAGLEIQVPASALPVYKIAATSDSAYQIGTNAEGILTMTVNNNVNGLKYFTVTVTPPVTAHVGKESVVFVHSRDEIQLSLNITRADFDIVDNAQAGFNVRPGDVIKAYIVDELTNALDCCPIVLQ